MSTRPCLIASRTPSAAMRVIAYSMLAVGGVAILSVPAERYEGITNALHILWGVLALAGIPAIGGVITGRFRLEWGALMPMAMSVAIYAALSWSLVAGAIEEVTTAGYVGAVLTVAVLAVLVGVVTNRLRRRCAWIVVLLPVAVALTASGVSVNQDIEHLTRAALLTALSAGFIGQFFSIWRRVVQARETAARLRGDPA